MAAIFIPVLDESPYPSDAGRPVRLRLIQGGLVPQKHSAFRARRRKQSVWAAMVGVVLVVIVGSTALFSVFSPQPTAIPTPMHQPGLGISAAAPQSGPVVVVQAGDTLTSIARTLQPTGDISSLVEKLAQNHGPAPLLAGDRLSLANISGIHGSGR